MAYARQRALLSTKEAEEEAEEEEGAEEGEEEEGAEEGEEEGEAGEGVSEGAACGTLQGAEGVLELMRSSHAASGYVGVRRVGHRYRAYTNLHGHQKMLGYFETVVDAATAVAKFESQRAEAEDGFDSSGEGSEEEEPADSGTPSAGAHPAATPMAGAALQGAVTHADGHKLHLSTKNATGYLNVSYRRDMAQSKLPFRATRPSGKSLGSFATSVEAAIAVTKSMAATSPAVADGFAAPVAAPAAATAPAMVPATATASLMPMPMPMPTPAAPSLMPMPMPTPAAPSLSTGPTIPAILDELGLAAYVHKFDESGFDDVEFLRVLSRAELMEVCTGSLGMKLGHAMKLAWKFGNV